MKKLLLGLAIAVLGLSSSGTTAGATDSCTISNTGPESTNSCVVKDDFTCKVENDNKFTVINNNDQEATTGDATASGNTSSGNATSGSATNSNGTVIDVSIVNGGCIVTAVTPPTPPAPVVPVGGSGSVNPPAQVVRPVGGMGAVAAPQNASPAVLPYTGAESALGIVAGIIATLGAVIVSSRIAVSTFNKAQL